MSQVRCVFQSAAESVGEGSHEAASVLLELWALRARAEYADQTSCHAMGAMEEKTRCMLVTWELVLGKAS